MQDVGVLKRPRGFIVLAAGTLVFVALAEAYLLLPPRQTSAVAVPPDHATPEQVVTAYLEALNAQDCGTAEALMTQRTKETAAQWCKDVASLTSVRVHG